MVPGYTGSLPSQETRAFARGYSLSCQKGTCFHTAACLHILCTITGTDMTLCTFPGCVLLGFISGQVHTFAGLDSCCLVCDEPVLVVCTCQTVYRAGCPWQAEPEDHLPTSSAAFALLPVAVQHEGSCLALMGCAKAKEVIFFC